MDKPLKYMTVTVESYPFGWDTKYYYMKVKAGLKIGDVIKRKDGKQYRIVDGKTQLELKDIDLNIYQLFEE